MNSKFEAPLHRDKNNYGPSVDERPLPKGAEDSHKAQKTQKTLLGRRLRGKTAALKAQETPVSLFLAQLPNVKTISLHKQRIAADAQAKVYLDAASPVTHQHLSDVLELWGFDKNTRRTNVIEEAGFVHSDTFGLVKLYGKWVVTRATTDYPHVALIFSRYLENNKPQGLPDDIP